MRWLHLQNNLGQFWTCPLKKRFLQAADSRKLNKFDIHWRTLKLSLGTWDNKTSGWTFIWN